jgi:hypothetical protein
MNTSIFQEESVGFKVRIDLNEEQCIKVASSFASRM